jgi:hypothetical protein
LTLYRFYSIKFFGDPLFYQRNDMLGGECYYFSDGI